MVIKTKIIAVIALTIILSVGVTSAIVFRIQTQTLVKSKMDDTIFVGDIIERTIENAMREGRNDDVQKILENIGKNKEIIALRILSLDGTVLKSTSMAEIGRKTADYATISPPLSAERPSLVDESTVRYLRPIFNRSSCFGCHNESEPVIALTEIRMDVGRNVALLASIKRLLIFSSLAVVVIVSFVLSILSTRIIIRPLTSLLEAIREVEGGNWNATVAARSDDEIGTLGAAFNRMIGEVNRLYRRDLAKERELARMRQSLEHRGKVEELNTQLEFKVRELETANRAVTSLSQELRGKNLDLERAVERLRRLNDVGRMLTSIIDPRELLKIITHTTADILNASHAILHIGGSPQPPLTIRFQRGHGTHEVGDFVPDGNPQIADLLARGKPFFHHQVRDSREQGSETWSSQTGVPLRIKGKIIGAMLLKDKTDSGFFTEDDMEILSTLSNQAIVAIENAWLYESAKGSYFSTIQSLVNALEANDRFTKGHSERVRHLSLELGRHLGLDVKEMEILEHAAILHDIGKIGIDSFIIQKQGKLTASEYGLIKSHPIIGDAILGPIDTLSNVRQTIIQHHERYDGKGYPFGLQGEELSFKARILSVVDTFDAMMSDRPYRTCIPVSRIRDELMANAGTQFDPYIVGAFLELLDSRGVELLSSAGYGTSHTHF